MGVFPAHGEAIGKPVTFVEVPASLIYGFDPVRGARASENLIFNHAYDIGKLHRMLGFKHHYSLVAGLSQTISFLDRWNLIEPTRNGRRGPDNRIVHQSGRAEDGGSRSGTADESRYTPPKNVPLVNWAPDQFSPCE